MLRMTVRRRRIGNGDNGALILISMRLRSIPTLRLVSVSSSMREEESGLTPYGVTRPHYFRGQLGIRRKRETKQCKCKTVTYVVHNKSLIADNNPK